MEGVLQLRYLGHTLDQTDDDWTEIRQNIKRAQKFWGRLGKMLLREGEDNQV